MNYSFRNSVLLAVLLLHSATAIAQFGPLHLVGEIEVYWPIEALVLDADNDGDNDILSVSSTRIALFRNDGVGGMGRAQDVGARSSIITAAQFADMDQDGDVDILVCRNGRQDETHDTLEWQPNDGSYHFGPAVRIGLGPFDIRAVEAADLDGDGLKDVVSMGKEDDLIGWHRNDGAGGFDPFEPLFNDMDRPLSFATGDMDGDNDVDILVGLSGNDRRVIWLRNDGNGSFELAPQLALLTSDVNRVRLFDIDEDGDVDAFSCSNSGKVHQYLNMGAQGFDAPLEISNAGSTNLGLAGDVGLADIDGDSVLDLWVFRALPAKMSYRRGLGNATFAVSELLYQDEDFASPYCIWSDLTGDGQVDLVSGHSVEGNTTIWYFPNDAGVLADQFVEVGQRMLHPDRLRSVDMDNDDDLDLVITNRYPETIIWMENTGSDLWMEHQIQVLNEGYYIQDMLCADKEGDGDMDVLMVSETSIGTASAIWLVNDGSANFGTELAFSIGQNDGRLRFGDIDGDGLLDIVNFYLGTGIKYLRALPGGGFAAVSTLGLNSTKDGDVGDMDGDGDNDILVTAGSTQEYIGYYENSGNMSYAPVQYLTEDAVRPTEPRLVDMDIDGDLDVLYVEGIPPSVTWLENDNGIFEERHFVASTWNTWTTEENQAVADLDGDGDPDLLLASSTLLLYPHWVRNDGAGNFEAPIPLAAATEDGLTVCPADMDGDGDMDIALSFDGHYLALEPNSVWVSTGHSRTGPSMEGRLFRDLNANGTYDPGEPPHATAQLFIDPLSATPIVEPDGTFRVLADPGQYTVTATSTDGNWILSGTAAYTASLTVDNPVASGLDLGFIPVQESPAVATSLGSGIMHCEGQATLWTFTSNTGTEELNGTVKMGIDPLLTYASAEPPPNAVIGDTLIWDFAGLPVDGSLSYRVLVTLPGSGQQGAWIVNGTRVQATATTGTVVTDSHTHGEVLNCAEQSTAKTSEPAGEGELHVVPLITEYLDYTIRFRNNGSSPISTVVIEDPLAVWFDPGTVQFMGSSHTCTMQLLPSATGSGHLRFQFDDIALPPSSQDAAQSVGLVSFRAQMIPGGLYHGAAVQNDATIMLLGDAPVITTENTYVIAADCDAVALQIEQIYLHGTTTLRLETHPYLFLSYQWYLNDALLPGQTTSTLEPVLSGTYAVEAHDEFGCTIQSEAYEFISSAIPETTSAKYTIAPNPAQDQLRIMGAFGEINAARMIDPLGRIILDMQLKGTDQLVLDRARMANGLYVLQLLDRHGSLRSIHQIILQ